MKPSGTLKFFAAAVAALALLCIVFPKDGIALGSVTLRFPTLHKVLVREKEKSMDQLLVKRVERDLTGARDSIEACRSQLFEGQTRIWLPNDNIACFDKFFASIENAVGQKRIVRVLHYGDSQIEQDRISCRLRERLQTAFGGGGGTLRSAMRSTARRSLRVEPGKTVDPSIFALTHTSYQFGSTGSPSARM